MILTRPNYRWLLRPKVSIWGRGGSKNNLSPLDQKAYHSSNLYHMALVKFARKYFLPMFLWKVSMWYYQNWGRRQIFKFETWWWRSTHSFIFKFITNVLICYNSTWEAKNNDMKRSLSNFYHLPLWITAKRKQSALSRKT